MMFPKNGDTDEDGNIYGPDDCNGHRSLTSNGCVWVERARLPEYEAFGWKEVKVNRPDWWLTQVRR